ASSSSALKRLTPSRWAPDRSALAHFAPRRSAPRRSARERSNPLKSRPRRAAPDKSGTSPCPARHAFHAAAPRPSKATCSFFGILPPHQPVRQLRCAIAVRPSELSLGQTYGARQIGIGEVRAVEFCQT